MQRVLILAVAAGLAAVNLVFMELLARADAPPQEAAPANPGVAGQGKAAADVPVALLPAVPSQEMVAEVRIEGNQAIGLDRIRTKIRTRPQRPYLEEQVQDDVRGRSTKWALRPFAVASNPCPAGSPSLSR